jgi:aromatic-L-amino-acid decarboxylase
MVAPTPFALVSFAHKDGDEATTRIVEAVNGTGHSYVTASRIADREFIRVSIGQTHTRQEHVDRLWKVIDANS